MDQVDYTKLWQLRNPHEPDGSLYVKIKSPPLKTDDFYRIVRAEVRPTQPIEFVSYLGQFPRDLIGTGRESGYLLSDRVIQKLAENHFTGWSTYPVRIITEQGDVIPGYHGFAVSGRAGVPIESRSIPVMSKGGVIPRLRGLFFDETKWDRSDIFLVGMRVCLTQRVYDALVEMSLLNMQFTRLDQVTSAVIEIES